MRRTVLTLILGAALVASLCVGSGQADVPLAATISPPQMIAPGRVAFIVAIAGLRPELGPTIQGTLTVGGHAIQGPQAPVPAAQIPVTVDLPAGRVRVGGNATVVEFTTLPPLEENTPIAMEVTIRQVSDIATAGQSGVLLLPTVIVPGYLNDVGGKPKGGLMSVLEQRGYHATGPSPDLFWFSYRSRALGLKGAGQALAAYVREEVLPKTYAARINVVGFSLGGLLVRWNLAFEPGWDHLVNRFVMVGVPNEGSVLSYVYGLYAVAGLARTAAARELVPTFPYWQPAPGAPWRFPPDGENPALTELNTHALPDGIRAYDFYGNQEQLDAHDHGTWAGIAGDMRELPKIVYSFGPGDGIVLTASALGLPINGGPGIPGMADGVMVKTDLGPVGHLSLLATAGEKIADALTDRRTAARPHVPMAGETRQPAVPRVLKSGVGFPLAGAGFPAGDGPP
jgi:hypothetical protein